MNFDTHRAGLLLHPTSLPSGTLADAERWLDFLHAAGVRVWQMLPLGLPLVGLVPLSMRIRFCGQPGFVSRDAGRYAPLCRLVRKTASLAR